MACGSQSSAPLPHRSQALSRPGIPDANDGMPYSPFVRLALARYQHFSTAAELKLSHIVTLDFAQLIPDRTLRVDWVGDSDDLIDVSLAGVAPDGPNLNRVEVTIEQHDGAIP